MAESIVDVHAHFTDDAYLEAMEAFGASMEDGFPLPTWNAQEHLALMDKRGIDWALLSVSSPHPFFQGHNEECIALCRGMNERMAQVKNEHPDRFGFQAVLPLPDVEASIAEARYAFDTLGANGIKLASNSRGLYLGGPELDPLMEVLNERGAVCTIHPHRPEPMKEGVFSAGPVPLFEFIADTTRAVLNLIANGVVVRYPEVTWVVPHCGSFLPNICDRFEGVVQLLAPKGLIQDIDVRESVDKLYFDLAGNPAPHLLGWLLTIANPKHVMYGSDFPFTPDFGVEYNLDKLLELLDCKDYQPMKQDILCNNAKELFGL